MFKIRCGVNKVIIILITCLFVLTLTANAFGSKALADQETWVKTALERAVQYQHDTFVSKDFAGVLDWPAVGLFAAGEKLTDDKWSVSQGKNGLYWREQEVATGEGLDLRSTEYERTILGIMAAGGNPNNFAGLNLMETLRESQLPSGKFADRVDGQGEYLVNAHIWGIITLYAAGEEVPNSAGAYRWLADYQNDDGGFSIDIDDLDSDIDVTAMALNALAALEKSKDDPVVVRAIDFLLATLQDDGNLVSWGMPTSESCAAVISGLVALGIDPMGEDWTRKGHNPVTALLDYQLPEGAFAHTPGGKADGIASQNALIALADLYNGQSVYSIMREKNKLQLFTDLNLNHWAYEPIANLVGDKIIEGYPDGSFQPDKEVSRAEFVKFVIFGLGLNETSGVKTEQFEDVTADHWAKGLIDMAVSEGLVNGVSETAFDPDGYVTGEQVMTILVRALGLEEDSFQDATPWYEKHIEAAVDQGLLYPEFRIGEAVTRAQCAYSVDILREGR